MLIQRGRRLSDANGSERVVKMEAGIRKMRPQAKEFSHKNLVSSQETMSYFTDN